MRNGFLSLGMKRPWRETDCSHSSSAEAKNDYWGNSSTALYAYALKVFRRSCSVYINCRVSGPRTLQGKKLPRVPHVYNTFSTRICEPWVLIKSEYSTSLLKKTCHWTRTETAFHSTDTFSVTRFRDCSFSLNLFFFFIGIIPKDGQEWSTLRRKVQRRKLDTASCYFDVLQLTHNTGLQSSTQFASQVYHEMFEWMLELMLRLKLLNSIFVSTVSQILLIP